MCKADYVHSVKQYLSTRSAVAVFLGSCYCYNCLFISDRDGVIGQHKDFDKDEKCI
jgi:hypothetical protein